MLSYGTLSYLTLIYVILFHVLFYYVLLFYVMLTICASWRFLEKLADPGHATAWEKSISCAFDLFLLMVMTIPDQIACFSCHQGELLWPEIKDFPTSTYRYVIESYLMFSCLLFYSVMS